MFKTFSLLKKIVRVMTFNKITDHSNPIFARLEFLKIDDIRQLQLLSFVYDCLNKTAPLYFHDYFVLCSQLHHLNTRLASRGDLFLERKNTFQYGIRSIEYNGARLWNMLPVSIRESSSGSVFRSELKKHLLSAYSHNHSEYSSESILYSDLLIELIFHSTSCQNSSGTPSWL